MTLRGEKTHDINKKSECVQDKIHKKCKTNDQLHIQKVTHLYCVVGESLDTKKKFQEKKKIFILRAGTEKEKN